MVPAPGSGIPGAPADGYITAVVNTLFRNEVTAD